MASNEECEPMYTNDEKVDLICRWNTCMMRFNSMEDLVSHVHSSHVYHQDGMYHCMWDHCPRGHRGFNARYKMTIHLRTHTMEKPFMCKQCLKRFSRQENLRIHIRTHTGEKPYKCNTEGCGKTYSNSSDRFKHSRTHEDDRPYFCKFPNCPKRYTDPSSLRKHVKMYNHSVNRLSFSPAQQPLNSYNRPQSISPDSSRSSSSLDASPILQPPPLINPAFHQTENTINRGMSAENYEAIGRAFTARQYAHFQPMHNLVFGSNSSSGTSVNSMNLIGEASGYTPIHPRENMSLYMFGQSNSADIDVVGDEQQHRMERAEAIRSSIGMDMGQSLREGYLPRMGEALALLYPNENRDEPGPSSLPLDLSMPSARRRRRRDQIDSESFAWPKQKEQDQ